MSGLTLHDMLIYVTSILKIINLKRSRDPSDKKLWNKLLVHSYSYNGITT